MPEIVGEYVDRLCAIEMRFQSPPGGIPRGVMHRLFDAARADQSGPMSYLAARGLVDRVKPGDVVFVVTGAGSPPFMPKGETDGPPGAASLARALDVALGAKPVLMSEPHCLPGLIASAEAAGVACLPDEMLHTRGGRARAIEFPYGPDTRDWAKEMVERYDPKAMIFIEKGGPNERGVFHTIVGTAKPDHVMAYAHYFVEEAGTRSILTIGIGDGGNEIGFGRIHAKVKDIQPAGDKCLCPCASGIATVVGTDVLICAAISNWGSYGLAAMLALLTGRPEALQDEETQWRILEANVRAGGMDGAYAKQIMGEDGVSVKTSQALVTMLHQIIYNASRDLVRGF
jgi:D-glutamate cyclase